MFLEGSRKHVERFFSWLGSGVPFIIFYIRSTRKNLINIIIYAIKNLRPLQEIFIKENKKFRIYDKQYMLKNLIECYHKTVACHICESGQIKK